MLTGMEPFEPFLTHWELRPDGATLASLNGRLLPVWRGGTPLMLRVATATEEEQGAATLAWWDGDGAARVLARDGTALLMERAPGSHSLARMAREGQDEEATRVLCAVAVRLHAPRPNPPPGLVPLPELFRDLEPTARAHAAKPHGDLLLRAHATAQALLAEPQEPVVLHGDLHHGNVLDFGPGRGWLAIDPKGVWGERGFDHANIFTNPDLDHPDPPVATVPAIFQRRLELVAEAAHLERRRLLEWVLAWCGLSAAWFLGDGDEGSACLDLAVAALAAADLDR